MILDARSGLRGRFLNLDTQEWVRFVRWYDDETGEYEAFALAEDGRQMANPPRILRCRARLRFFPDAGRVSPPSWGGPPARLCSRGRGRGTPLPPLNFEECEVRGCHQKARWAVNDWQQVEPEQGEDGRLYDCGVLLRRHVYCNRCYRNPTEISLRGVESEVDIQVARPQ